MSNNHKSHRFIFTCNTIFRTLWSKRRRKMVPLLLSTQTDKANASVDRTPTHVSLASHCAMDKTLTKCAKMRKHRNRGLIDSFADEHKV